MIVPGFALLGVGLAATGRSGEVLATVGGLATMAGLVLSVQNATDRFETWAYAWTLVVVVGPGIGRWLVGVGRGRGDLAASGGWLIGGGLVGPHPRQAGGGQPHPGRGPRPRAGAAALTDATPANCSAAKITPYSPLWGDAVTAAGSYRHEQTRKRAGGEVPEVARAIRAAGVRQAAELDLFRLYLNEIGRRPLLTKQDEARLSRADQAGLDAQRRLADTAPDDPARPDLEAVAERGEWARRTMVEANLRLVVSIARRFSATGLPIGDLVQEGNMQLLRAVERFDWRKGVKFSTDATW